ncbi:MAG: hypothetical protein ACR2LA_00275 [Acidimicrobiales bacterium]
MSARVLADLTASDLALVVVTGCSVVAVVAVLFTVTRLLTLLRRVTVVVDTLTAEALPLVEDLGASLADANEELERVDKLVGSAEAISATVDATSKLAYRALAAPVIKTVAVTSGASRAAKRLRKD